MDNNEKKLEPEQLTPLKIKKGWGYEIWMVNNKKYCGKILHFEKSAEFSMHFHIKKDETWYVNKGSFIFRWIDTTNADVIEKTLNEGDCIHIPPGLPHQLKTINGGEIIETSTEHFDIDSYRVAKGDSQREIIEASTEHVNS